MKWVFLLFFPLVVSAFEVGSATARQPAEGKAFQIYIENDSRRIGGPGSDQSYSNGVKLTYIDAEDKVPNWADSLLKISRDLEKRLEKSKTNFGLSLGHQIYTPSNTKTEKLITNDRPYAAWLFLSFAAFFHTEAHSDSLELSLGVVGPQAAGEKIQNTFHRAIGTYPAAGWDNEIGTEPTLQIFYQQRVKFIEKKSKVEQTYFDILPYYGGSFGNVRMDVHIGSLIRFGRHIPDDFGPARPSGGDGNSYVQPSSFLPNRALGKLGFYGFAGGRAILVARDIFLDGNSFRKSHHVTKYPVVSETELGMAGQWDNMSVVWRFVVRSPEFEEKSKFNSFASLTFTSLFR